MYICGPYILQRFCCDGDSQLSQFLEPTNWGPREKLAPISNSIKHEKARESTSQTPSPYHFPTQRTQLPGFSFGVSWNSARWTQLFFMWVVPHQWWVGEWVYCECSLPGWIKYLNTVAVLGPGRVFHFDLI